jgi:hypothetical protein
MFKACRPKRHLSTIQAISPEYFEVSVVVSMMLVTMRPMTVIPMYDLLSNPTCV